LRSTSTSCRSTASTRRTSRRPRSYSTARRSMPPRAAHLEQARQNRDHARFLVADARVRPVALQWAVTVAFYCAVHCIEAHLATSTCRRRFEGGALPNAGVATDDVANSGLVFERRAEREETGRRHASVLGLEVEVDGRPDRDDRAVAIDHARHDGGLDPLRGQ